MPDDTYTQVGSDDFQRADEFLQTGNWSVPTGGNPCQIVNASEVKAAAASVRVSYWSANALPNDQYAEINYSYMNSSYELGPCTRIQAGVNSYYQLGALISSLALWRYDAGSVNVLFTKTGLTIAAGDVARLVSVGDMHIAFLNGTALFALRDATYPSGYAGVGGNNQGSRGESWACGYVTRHVPTGGRTGCFLGRDPHVGLANWRRGIFFSGMKRYKLAAYGNIWQAAFWGLTLNVQLTDSGAASDALANLQAALALTDSGSGADSIAQVLKTILVALSDSGSGSDALVAPRVSFTLTDSGAGGSGAAPSITARLTLNDSASSSDVLAALQNLIHLVDQAGGTDVLVYAGAEPQAEAILVFSLHGHRIQFELNRAAIGGGGIRSASVQSRIRKPRIDITME
jgi:hypothetical protein